MEEIVREWTTLELLEFLTSYNRMYKTEIDKTNPYQELYIHAFAELNKRYPLMALLY